MATYAIGDIQGCFRSLEMLLEKIGFTPARDRLWLTGDLVSRGPDSLAVLRWAMRMQKSIVTVLGNHDLHLLAIAQGVKKGRESDLFEDILTAPDREDILNWVRNRPLLHEESGFVLIHAGLLPQWDIRKSTALAKEVESALRSPNYHVYLKEMYGNTHSKWSDSISGYERFRFIINVMTRMRVIKNTGELDFEFSGKPDDAPVGTVPWDKVQNRKNRGKVIVCGHWAARGFEMNDDVIFLDSGCVWGNCMTAVRLSDRVAFQVPCEEVDKKRKGFN